MIAIENEIDMKINATLAKIGNKPNILFFNIVSNFQFFIFWMWYKEMGYNGTGYAYDIYQV